MNPTLLTSLKAAHAIEPYGKLLKSLIRYSTCEGQLFVHSSFPTDNIDSVFFGPDTYRFAAFIKRSLRGFDIGDSPNVVDIGCGSGAGGIIAAKMLRSPRLFLADINPSSVAFAEVNARLARIGSCECVISDVLGNIDVVPDLIVSNPPYMLDTQARTYRHGGGGIGSELSLRILDESLQRLRVGGSLILYTGSAIVEGNDCFYRGARAVLDKFSCTHKYEEIDPDVFGEQLQQPGYERVERIAAVGLVATLTAAPLTT